ncbi:MAG TPA: flagellar basal body L-ring protein FlgH [Longimicrobiaceae bacterium]|nr:flagellar basal body L-ring protein FlgH [Longimicrobiaceae bacterium]
MRKLVLALATLAVAAVPLRAQDSTAAVAVRAPRQSWTSDRRDFSVGDVITVLIDESTLASATSGDQNTDQRSRDADFSLGHGVLTAGALSADLGSHNDAQSRVSGQATRTNQFRGEMTVRVTAVEPGGRMRVEGTKVVNVDKNKQQLGIKGWVRPQDVSADNYISSVRIANAEVVYTSTGSLGKPKGGILSKLLGALWP